MTEHSFWLIPFPNSKVPPIQIAGKASRANNVLSIHYYLTGAYETVLFPDRSPYPERQHDLWKATCFEFFLAIPGQPPYWEFNMSPSGNWNVYHMQAYRRIGFHEEILIQELPFSVQKATDAVLVDVAVDLGFLVSSPDPLQLGITCVIQTKAGDESYWALAHPGTQPDFHLRDSYVIELR